MRSPKTSIAKGIGLAHHGTFGGSFSVWNNIPKKEVKTGDRSKKKPMRRYWPRGLKNLVFNRVKMSPITWMQKNINLYKAHWLWHWILCRYISHLGKTCKFQNWFVSQRARLFMVNMLKAITFRQWTNTVYGTPKMVTSRWGFCSVICIYFFSKFLIAYLSEFARIRKQAVMRVKTGLSVNFISVLQDCEIIW